MTLYTIRVYLRIFALRRKHIPTRKIPHLMPNSSSARSLNFHLILRYVLTFFPSFQIILSRKYWFAAKPNQQLSFNNHLSPHQDEWVRYTTAHNTTQHKAKQGRRNTSTEWDQTPSNFIFIIFFSLLMINWFLCWYYTYIKSVCTGKSKVLNSAYLPSFIWMDITIQIGKARIRRMRG